MTKGQQNDYERDIFAEAEEEVREEARQQAKAQFKGQLRKVQAAREVLRNEERALEVIRRSIEA